MKTVLFSLNASRSHTNLAIRLLKASLEKQGFSDVTLIERTEKERSFDTLSALVAVSVNAELLIILSDVDGLYSADPHKSADAKLIESVYGVTDETFEKAGGAGSALGTGGMKTKIKAAKICTESGCDVVIANGENPEILYDIVSGNQTGYTRFFSAAKKSTI